MNALAPPLPAIPENAPFSPAQRAWLNGFLAGLYGGGQAGLPAGGPAAALPGMSAAAEEEFPWHDPALDLAERQKLAEGRPLARRLMAAMAQLDCGQCGYLCQTYGEALAEGRETSAGLCVPGEKATMRALKAILAEAPAALSAPRKPDPVTPVAVKPATPPGRPVTVLEAARLTGAGSAKDVRHVVIDLAGSGLVYEAGDSISLAAPGDPSLVEACLRALGASGEERVPCPDGVARPAREAFTAYLDIARPLDRSTELLAMAAAVPAEAAMLRRLTDGEDGAEPQDADLLDLLLAFPSARPSLADLARSLPALKPRLYSIASSPRAAPGQVHLCVGVVQATRRARLRGGVASSFLAERAVAAGPIMASIQASHFRLPADPATPIIMVGPGTGIAPFRAFLQERASQAARGGGRGRAWLFFGDQHAASDFLYGPELRAWLADGTLTRLDTAFSRDQAQKIYVQDRMREQAADLWRWLQEGGHFYVCGDASRMARDVDAALRGIAMRQGGLDEAQARDWIVALARQGRYLRDVY
ncbi:MAG: sulfite reductase subunit alpha [Rhodospirillales bacterium]|nr:sulfite reductase subunit alpha [Rhodospirillales bacterium]